jgi:DNA-binding XRE family transcriptional regulator
MKIYKKNIYTQAEYAKVIDLTPARVNQLIKDDELPDNTRILCITGATLIEIKKD